jgi:UPF0176 protein
VNGEPIGTAVRSSRHSNHFPLIPVRILSSYVVAALYKFVSLPDYTELREPLLRELNHNGVKGTILLAEEGINGTIAGNRDGIDAVLSMLRADERLSDLEHKESFTDDMPFLRSKVKLKKEIVTMGVEGIDPPSLTGSYVEPEDWNALISDPDVILIDARNDYEYRIGSFRSAVNPHTDSFREFPDFLDRTIGDEKQKKVAMFCTGGIRCEKSTAYLRQKGYENVFHLHGGVLKYLETVAMEDSLWEGECFVFDNRVAVNHDLEPGSYGQCFACRMPLSDEDLADEAFVQGESCPHCIDSKSDEDRLRYAERERQMALARSRGRVHLGSG